MSFNHRQCDLNVLVIAEAANPEWTSVPLLGWLHTQALSKKCNVHLVTQIRNKKDIESEGWEIEKDFTAIDTEFIAAFIHKLSKLLRGNSGLAWTINTALESLSYPFFEYLVWKQFKQQLKSGKYDVVHRITPVSPTAPSYLAKKLHSINVPFVVGPMNGGVPWPKQFREVRHKEREWLSYVRDFYKLLPGYLSLRKHSDCLLAGSLATKNQIPDQFQDKVLYIPENAIDLNRFSVNHTHKTNNIIKAAFVGRLVPYKGPDIALRAIAPFLKSGSMEFDIFGDGPMREELSQLIKQLGVESSVKMHGFVENKKLQQKLQDSDLFLFPSLREFGGAAVMEAMALGLVPVVVDYAGPSEYVTEMSGYKIPLAPREELIRAFQEKLYYIKNNIRELERKRSMGKKRITEHYSWERKTDQILEVYDWVLGRSSKPQFYTPPLDNLDVDKIPIAAPLEEIQTA
ncbi:hypothetical protein NBRC116591_27100 [Sessilibacter corallicola]|uniref:Glycosyl transferase family 1 domain-containing protein n=2 Tax=Sessilibacter corallicola TaxID=2904075 RepID=A0ABQ0AB71_9GAMM